MALEEFEKKFNTEEACRDLFNLRWPSGFECPKCGNNKAWPIEMFCLNAVNAVIRHRLQLEQSFLIHISR